MIAARHDAVLAALLTSSTKAEAATKAHVSQRTVYKLLQDPDFAKRYADARQGMVADATAQLQQTLAPAVGVLSDIASDPAAAPPARVSAARATLEFALRYTETSDILARLAKLEESAGENNGNQWNAQTPD